MLDKQTFSFLIKHSPLISIDLIIINGNEEILLGKRKNNPAKGYWFVPGGRIFKDEKLSNAFERISENELGIKVNMECSNFVGVFEHFYENNFFNENFSTHYIAIAFKIRTDHLDNVPKEQHEELKWFKIPELLRDSNVHENTKNYFLLTKGIR